VNTYHCSVCGKKVEQFDCHRKRIKHTFCSKKCRLTPFIQKQCSECGKTFLATAQTASSAMFCSRECVNAKNRREEIHKKGKLVKCTCERCGKVFKIRSSVAKVQRYCSQKCSGASIGESQTGKDNPRWKPKVKLNCDYCGKEFKTYPSRIGRKKYCCKKHRLLGHLKRLASNPRTDIEKAMAEALTKAGIEHEEQVTMCDKFLVDFLLPAHKLVVQCDGVYWHDRPEVIGRDKGQDRYLTKCGYTVLRFTDKQIYNNISKCIEKIKRTILLSKR